MGSILSGAAPSGTRSVRWLHAPWLELRGVRNYERDSFPERVAHESIDVAVTELRGSFFGVGVQLGLEQEESLHHTRLFARRAVVLLLFEQPNFVMGALRLVRLNHFRDGNAARAAELRELEDASCAGELERTFRVTNPKDRTRFVERFDTSHLERDTDISAHLRLFSAVDEPTRVLEARNLRPDRSQTGQ